MKKRMILMLAVATVFLGAIGFVKYRQVQAGMAQNANFQPPPEAVTTIVAKQEPWPQSLSAIGTVDAVQGVTVSADLPGIVERIHFESGKTVRNGAILVQLDTRQERAQLSAAEAQRKLTGLSFERIRGLREKGILSQAEYDRAAAEQTQGQAQVGEIHATIGRKTIRAPFSGILGLRQVNLGQYLNPGDPIVSLQSLDPVYVNFSLPQEAIGQLKLGTEVRASTENTPDVQSVGTVTALNSVVDEDTRNIQAQATLGNPDGRLRPGMFVQAQVVLGASQPVVSIPASAINYAPYGNSVFIVTNLKGQDGKTYRGVKQQFVKLGSGRGDQVAVTSGVKAGEEIVTSGVFKLRNGAAVEVNNKIQPGNNPAPKPEDS